MALKPTPLCDAYVTARHLDHGQDLFPLDLYFCHDCGFVQIGCVVDSEYIYSNYIYVTGSSSGLNTHFQNYARDTVNMFQLRREFLVVDIGSNDGTFQKVIQMGELSSGKTFYNSLRVATYHALLIPLNGGCFLK